MDNEKIRMPAGAIIACILIIVFILAGIAAVWLFSDGKLYLPGKSSGQTAAVEGTVSPTEWGFVTPTPTKRPAYTPSEGDTGAKEGESTVDILANCMSTVVSIDVSVMSGHSEVVAGSGSGVIISEDGLIVTCNHVVEGAASVDVFLNDGSTYKADVLGTDSVTDIAVIKLKADGVKFPCATLGSSEELHVGDRVYAIGNALGELSNTVTEGIISGLGRDIEVNGQSMSLLQTSAAINEGNSGGALFRYDGTLIGIVNAKSSGVTSSGATIDGLGFAVPIDIAKPIIEDIVTYGYVTGRPYLGVSTKNVTFGGMFTRYTYPQVVSVVEGGPADIAGIKENDIITQINGASITSSTALRVEINKYKVGDKITVVVQRDSQVLTFEVTLLERTSR